MRRSAVRSRSAPPFPPTLLAGATLDSPSMKIGQAFFGLVFAALSMFASQSALAATCTAAKSQADKQRIDAFVSRGDIRVVSDSAVWVSDAYWTKTPYAQKGALADSVVCARVGPGGSVYS